MYFVGDMAKSDLHIDLAQRALVWLETHATQRGIRGCEEVILETGYVVDSAAVCGLTIKSEKLFMGMHFDSKVEHDRMHNNRKQSDDYAFAFESKVSRADFLKTFKHDKHKGSRNTLLGNFNYIVTPKALLKLEEIPEQWGWLEQSGVGLRIAKLAPYASEPLLSLEKFAYRVLRSIQYGKYAIYESKINDHRDEQKSKVPARSIYKAQKYEKLTDRMHEYLETMGGSLTTPHDQKMYHLLTIVGEETGTVHQINDMCGQYYSHLKKVFPEPQS